MIVCTLLEQKVLEDFFHHLHPLQAANCRHNSRLVVDEGGLKRLANKNKILLSLTCLCENFRSNDP